MDRAMWYHIFLLTCFEKWCMMTREKVDTRNSELIRIFEKIFEKTMKKCTRKKDYSDQCGMHAGKHLLSYVVCEPVEVLFCTIYFNKTFLNKNMKFMLECSSQFKYLLCLLVLCCIAVYIKHNGDNCRRCVDGLTWSSSIWKYANSFVTTTECFPWSLLSQSNPNLFAKSLNFVNRQWTWAYLLSQASMMPTCSLLKSDWCSQVFSSWPCFLIHRYTNIENIRWI